MKKKDKLIEKRQCDITGKIKKRLKEKIESGITIKRSKINRTFLYNLYWIYNLSTPEIASLFDYSSSQTIRDKFIKYKISIKNNKECQSRIKIDKSVLISLYIDKKLSTYEISNKFDCGTETIRRLLKKYNIERRSCYHKMAGWNRGLSKKTDDRVASYAKKLSKTLLNGRERAPKKYGKDWYSQRKRCLKRDGYKCSQCQSKENLNVHHWEPYRFSYDNRLINLITLCENCHIEIHKWYKNEGFIEQAELEYY